TKSPEWFSVSFPNLTTKVLLQSSFHDFHIRHFPIQPLSELYIPLVLLDQTLTFPLRLTPYGARLIVGNAVHTSVCQDYKDYYPLILLVLLYKVDSEIYL